MTKNFPKSYIKRRALRVLLDLKTTKIHPNSNEEKDNNTVKNLEFWCRLYYHGQVHHIIY